MKKKQKKWVSARHRIIRNLAYLILNPYIYFKYHAKITRFKEQGDRQYLILMNHQTAFDQFFIGSAFKGPVYYVASEDLFSNGWISRLLQWAVAPIPIKKQSTDARAVMNCLRVKREGGTIAIAPEGNRTYSGKTEYMKPAIAGLVKALKMPVAFFRIEGGYGVQPRWSDTTRKGKMRCFVSKVVEPEEYLAMSDEAFFELIQKELAVDEGYADASFTGKRKAEYIERAMYVCPKCGLSTFESRKNRFSCKKCGWEVEYTDKKELVGVNEPFPFRFVKDWYEYQNDFINALNPADFTQTPVYTETCRFSEVVLYKNKKLLDKKAEICLYGDKVVVTKNGERMEMPFSKITVATVLGRNKLNLYFEDKVYQCKGGKRFNALKYVHFCYRYKNVERGDENGKFLGI